MTTRKRAQKKPTTHAPAARYRVDRLDQVRLLAHPLRLRLFEAFALAPRTTRQVAQALGLAPTRLYHHVNALEGVGLLELRETRQVRGATEKYYQAVGRMLEIEPELFTPGRKAAIGTKGAAIGTPSAETIDALVAQLVGGVRADLGGALARMKETPASHRPVAARFVMYASPAKIAALRRRVVAWAAECSKSAKSAKAGRGPSQARTRRGAGRATFTLIFTSEPKAGGEPGAD